MGVDVVARVVVVEVVNVFLALVLVVGLAVVERDSSGGRLMSFRMLLLRLLWCWGVVLLVGCVGMWFSAVVAARVMSP